MPAAPAPHVWAERAPDRRPAPRQTASFAEVLERELAHWPDAA